MAIQDAVNLIKTACTQWSLGYDQHNRLDFRNGGETDCSALVILTCEQAGLLHGNNIRKNIGATYTGNMRANFRDRGWQVLPNLPVSQLKPGDVLLNDAHHTAMYVGNRQIAMASIDEHQHALGGAPGDPDRARDSRPLLLQPSLVLCPAFPRNSATGHAGRACTRIHRQGR
jgi:hypothetical protein